MRASWSDGGPHAGRRHAERPSGPAGEPEGLAAPATRSRATRVFLPVAWEELKRRWERDDRIFAYLLNIPSTVIILALVAYPVGYSFVLSLYRYNLKRPRQVRFNWFNNYWDILTDPFFWTVMQVTVYFVFVSIALILVVGMTLALLLNEPFRGRALLRSMLLIPWAMPPVVNGLMWQGILNGTYGVFNGVLFRLGLIDEYVGWLTHPLIALNMTALAHVWNNVPFAGIILLASLQAIPDEQYQAARVDGAGPVQRFWHVTLPWLLHPVLIILIYQTMLAFRVFDLIYTLTGGGPAHGTHVLAWQTYMTAFGSYDFGHGNAYSYIITIVTMTLAVIYIRLLYRRGEIYA